jgi:uncharacterized protein (TIGR02145 family)
MKKLLLFLILCLSFIHLNAQDIIYTVEGKVNNNSTPVDSILVENLSNSTRILFDNLPNFNQYNINLTHKALWGVTFLTTNSQNPGFKVTSSYPGFLCLTYDHDIPTVASVSVFNEQGQEVYSNINHIIKQGNTIRIYLGRSRFYAVRIKSGFGIQGFKVLGSPLKKTNETRVNYTGQANPFATFYARPAVLDDNFNYHPGDSIRISVYKKGYYAYPEAFRINGYDSIIFPFKISTVDSTGISDVYANLSDTSKNKKIIGYNTTNGDIQLKYFGKESGLNSGEIITVDLDTMGYLRKVISVSEKNGIAIVRTKQARMQDVFVNRDVKLDTKLIAPKIALKSTSSLKEIAKALTDDNGYIHPVKIIYQDHKGQSKIVDVLKEGKYTNGRNNIIDFYRDLKSDLYGKEGKNIHLYIDEGHISFTSDAVFTLNFTNNNAVANGSKAKIGNLRSVEFYLDSHADFLIKLALDMQKEYEKKDGKELARIPKVKAKFIVPPGIPVWITFKCTINSWYYFKSDAALHADWGFESNHSLKIGGLYSRETNRFEPIKKYTPKNTIFPLNITGDVNDTARLEIYPRVDIKLYGLLGPYAEIVPYITGNYHAKLIGQYSANNSQTFLAWNSGIDLGLDFRAGIDMSLIGSLCEASVNCFDIPLWSSPKKIELLSTLPNNIEPGKTLTLKYKVTDLKGNPVYLCPVYFNGPGRFNKQLVMTQMDGTVSCEWTATNPGNNSVQATIYRANKSIIDHVSTEITINDPPPLADFTAVPTLGVAPLKVTFIDQSANNPTNWEWDFGDGTSSREKTPIHTYINSGKYSVKLTVSNDYGKDVITKSDYILVGKPPKADFKANKKSGITPLTVSFTDQSTNSPSSWLWNFGDGNSSNQQNPQHTYLNAGNYTVSLTATNEFGKNTTSKVNYIVTGKPPVAAFETSDTSGTAPLTVHFIDQSTNEPTIWYWNFGDGSSSYKKNPVHKFINAGKYTVKLTVTNSYGSNSKENYINVYANTKPIALFTISSSNGTTSTTFSFDASGCTDKEDSTSQLQVRWDFNGDGQWDTDWSTNKTINHQYTSEGTFTVKLEVKDSGGLTDQASHSVVVSNGGGNTSPAASFTISPNSGNTSTNFTFDASGCTDKEDPTSQLQVRWDFNGDGQWDTDWSTNKTVEHHYTSEGNFTVKLEVKDSGGLTDQASHVITVKKEDFVTRTYTDPRDGKIYKTVKIGDQTWFAENLRYKTQNSWYYNNAPANGTLYSWNDAQTACPKGWHLPSDDEWKALEMHLGMNQKQADKKGWRGSDEGKKLKSKDEWFDGNNGNNLSGFNAKPRGQCTPDGSGGISFNSFFTNAYFWLSSTYSDTHAWSRMLYYKYDQVFREKNDKSYGFSVRCIKD